MKKIIIIIVLLLTSYNVTSQLDTNFTPNNTQYVPVYQQQQQQKQTDNSIFVAVVIALLGGSAGIWGVIKGVQQNKAKEEKNKRIVDMQKLEYTSKSEAEFQQIIVKRLIDEYVTQNTWVTTKFSDMMDRLIKLGVETNKLSKDVYAQIDVFRRELRDYHTQSSNVNMYIKNSVNELNDKIN